MFFRPDSTIFPKVEFDADVIRQRLEVSSYLHKGVKIVFEDEARTRSTVFQHTEGLADYLKKILAERTAVAVHEAPFTLSKESDESGVRLDLAMQWTQSTDEHVRSYVNGIPTGSGGTHENGFRAGLGKAVRNFIETHNLSPKGVTLTAEDIREGLVAVLSVFVAGAAVPGTDEGSAEQPRGDVRGRLAGAAGARALAQHQHQRRRVDRRAHHPRGARARGEPRRAAGSRAQDGRRRAASRCPASSATARRPAATTASSSSSKATRPAGRPSRDAIARARRSCRCAARC